MMKIHGTLSSTAVTAPARRAVFLDRDGTINRDVGFTHRVEELELLPRAAEGLARMMALGLRLVITTNQSGVARGYFPEADARRFHDALCKRLLDWGVVIDAVYYCPFHPTAGLAAYRRESSLRKPSDGMIRRAAAEHHIELAGSFAVGDKMSDIVAGRSAGCRTILICPRGSRPDSGTLSASPDFVAGDLAEAAEHIDRTSRSTRPTSETATPARARLEQPRRRSA
jgi:D-glycero-D-manno-heptose 1,7-bisphosphate phosphatase